MGSSASSERRQQQRQQRTVPNRQAPPPPQQQRYPAQQQQQQTRAPQQQQHAYPPQQQAPPPQRGGAVSEAQSIKNECTVMVESVKYDAASCVLSFDTNCNIPCEIELHVAVRVDVMHGSVMITPNKPKAPPQRLPVAPGAQHHAMPLDLTDVSEQEQKYLLEYPKQLPVVIALYYTAPTADPKQAEGDPSVSEYTMVQLLPQGKFLKQLLRTAQGVFKVENMFGGEHADVGTVVDPGAQRSESPQADATAGVVEDEDEDGLCVICLTNEKTTVVIPCRHLCLCKECAEELRQKGPKCPVCRGPLNQLVSVKS